MNSITGYIRLANEENTIISCLNSIKDIFDKILIIYSNVTDESLDLLHDYSKHKSNSSLNIVRYNQKVLPPHSKEYKNNTYNHINSLASYYNFGLSLIDTDLFMKIDADQIYLHDQLFKIVSKAKLLNKEKIYIGMRGYNCIVTNSTLKQHVHQPMNGGFDHFILSTDNALFVQDIFWEKLHVKNNIVCNIEQNPCWFHFKKGHRHDDKFISGNDYKPSSVKTLSKDLQITYRKNILPILIESNSPYQNLKYD
jgi:hypothetical protein